jgi:hypothetical protein
MTMYQIFRNLTREGEALAMQGEIATAVTCFELAAMIRDRGYINLPGKVDISNLTAAPVESQAA